MGVASEMTKQTAIIDALREVSELKEKLWFDDLARAKLDRVEKILLWIAGR